MIIAVLLFGYAALVGTATRLLRRTWVQRAPQLGIALWQLALGTVLGATALGLLALTVPVVAGNGLAGLLHACVMALRNGYRSPTNEELVFLLGLGLTIALVARAGGCLARELWCAARDRHRHVEALTLLGRPHAQPGVTVLEHSSPAAYCVPGRRRRIVLTTATLAALDAEQLAGVLAHERAHLTGRHDLILGSARALARAFPLPVFATAVHELAELVEMLADDAARTPRQRLTLAAALVNITSGEAIAPAIALAAAGTGVIARVRRLTRPISPLPRTMTAAAVLTGIVVAVTPIVIMLAPAIAAAALPYCPLSSG